MNKPHLNHFIIEITGICRKDLKRFKSIKPQILDFIKKASLKVVKQVYHNFFPEGTTAIFILSSSHLSVHSWPEQGYLHMDLLTCDSRNLDKMNIYSWIKDSFKTQKINVRRISYDKRN